MEVFLSKYIEEDAIPLFEWINDRELVQYNNPFNPISWENHLEYFRNTMCVEHKTAHFYAIKTLINDKPRLLGSCRIYNINKEANHGEVQIRLGSLDLRGMGIGSKALKELIEIAFEKIKLNRLFAYIYHFNESSLKLFEKFGFECTGVKPEFELIDRQKVNLLVYTLKR